MVQGLVPKGILARIVGDYYLENYNGISVIFWKESTVDMTESRAYNTT